MTETFTTGSLSSRSPTPILRERHDISQSEANKLYLALRKANVSPINIKRGIYQLPQRYQHLEERQPTKTYSSLMDVDTTYRIPERTETQISSFEKVRRLTSIEKAELKTPTRMSSFENIQRLTATREPTPIKKPIKEVGVAVSSSDLIRFRESFEKLGYKTAGELLEGIRKGEVKKEGETYTIIKPSTTKEEKKTKLTLADKGRKMLYSGVSDIKDFFKDYEKPDPRTKGETTKISTKPPKEPLKIFTGIGKVTYGFTTAFIGETYEQLLKRPTKEATEFSLLRLGEGIETKEKSLIKEELSHAEGGIALGMLFGTPMTTFKPSGLVKAGWYEADAIKTGTDLTYTFKKPGFDITGKRIRGFQPVDELGGLSKSKEIQSQIIHKDIEPLNLIKREVSPLKAILEKRGLQKEGLSPKPTKEAITFEELTGEARYKNLLETAKAEAKAKKTFYQRELIEYVDPRTKTPKVQLKTITETPRRIRILASKKAELKLGYESQVYEKGTQLDIFPETKTFITTTTGGIITKTPIRFARVIIPLTSSLIGIKGETDSETISNIKSKITSIIDMKRITKIDTGQEQILETPQDIGIKQITTPIQITGQEQDITPIQITDQDTITGINIISKTSPKPRTTPPETPGEPFSIPSPFTIPSTKKGLGVLDVFRVEVRRRGRFQEIGKGEDIEELFKKGRDITKHTARASFRITDFSGETISLDKLPRGLLPSNMFRESKKDRNVFIERRKFRIDSPGEKAEITAKGIFASKTKTKKKKKKFSFF